MDIRLRTKILNHKIGLSIVAKRVYNRQGITNICIDGKRCNFIDFSTTELMKYDHELEENNNNDTDRCMRKIVFTCEHNQTHFNIGDYFIIQSYPRLSFHAFCIDKINYELDKIIIRNTPYLDTNYSYFYDKMNYRVLRYIEKSDRFQDEQLKLIGMVKSDTNTRIKSRMHNIFFNLRYGVPIYDSKQLDNSKLEDIIIDKYESTR